MNEKERGLHAAVPPIEHGRIGARRLVGVVVGLLIAGVMTFGWATPNIAGGAFVSVRSVVVPLAEASAAAAGRSGLGLADGAAAPSGRVRIDIEITNRYPLPVVVTFQGPAFDARLTAPSSAGPASGPSIAWHASADDPELEQDVDSPAGGDASRVVRVQPGTRVVSMTSTATMDLSELPAGATPGTYSLAVTAYGIAAPEQAVTLVATAGP